MKNEMKLYQVFFYNLEGERDFTLFVANPKYDLENQFIKFAKHKDWSIDKDDIEIYPVECDKDYNAVEDKTGKLYLVKVELTKIK